MPHDREHRRKERSLHPLLVAGLKLPAKIADQPAVEIMSERDTDQSAQRPAQQIAESFGFQRLAMNRALYKINWANG